MTAPTPELSVRSRTVDQVPALCLGELMVTLRVPVEDGGTETPVSVTGFVRRMTCLTCALLFIVTP